MKKYFKFFIAAMFIIFLGSCKKNMTEMNTNEELLVSTDPKFVFTSATENWNNASRADLMGKYSGVMSYMQYIVSSTGGAEGIYANPTKASIDS